MIKLIPYDPIGQFRNVVKMIATNERRTGVDLEGVPVYDHSTKLPTLEVIATEKIHGTNASVCYSEPDGFWVQSRNTILTVVKDNNACADHAYQNKTAWMRIIHRLAGYNGINLGGNIITVFFEWSGGNIQKNSACTGLDKQAIILPHFKVTPIDEKDTPYWLETKHSVGYHLLKGVDSQEHNIFNITNSATWRFEIDFENPSLAVNLMLEVVKGLEESSKYGELRGIKGNIGEGLVCAFMYYGSLYRFKVKGDKHTATKRKKLNPVDETKVILVSYFSTAVTTASRLEQAWQTTFGIGDEKAEPDIKKTGNFIRYVIADVHKEEYDHLSFLGLKPKDVNPSITNIARKWFMEQLSTYFCNHN
jgi:hypothetical protein